jgi:predicted nucleic acid-binding protein
VAYPVLLDTCVLVPMYLRDSLLQLSVAGLYEPLWSRHILGELSTVLVREQMCSEEQAHRLLALLRQHFHESEVLDYEPLIPTMRCDEKDRHVLAAAVKANATVLASDNVSDFPRSATEHYRIEVLTADEFLLDLLDEAPDTVVRALTRQAERYKRDPQTLDGLLAALSRAGAPTFADEVRRRTA